MRSLPVLALCAMAAAVRAAAKSTAPEVSALASTELGGPLARLVNAVAKKSGTRFVLDPRVHADVIISGRDPASLTSADRLEVRPVYGYATFGEGGHTQVVPDAAVRTRAVPTVSETDSRLPSQVMSTVVRVRNASASYMLPMLRFLMPQSAHLAGMPCVNKLILLNTLANMCRLESIIRQRDI